MVERVNQTIGHVASTMCNGDGTQWAYHIGEIEYALNTRVSSVTKFSPYELVYGRLPPNPLYIEQMEGEGDGSWEEPKLRGLKRRISVLQQLAHENQMNAAEKQQSYFDAHAQAHTFKVGDKEWLYKPSTAEKGVTSKLAYRWTGPYTVTIPTYRRLQERFCSCSNADEEGKTCSD